MVRTGHHPAAAARAIHHIQATGSMSPAVYHLRRLPPRCSWRRFRRPYEHSVCSVVGRSRFLARRRRVRRRGRRCGTGSRRFVNTPPVRIGSAIARFRIGGGRLLRAGAPQVGRIVLPRRCMRQARSCAGTLPRSFLVCCMMRSWIWIRCSCRNSSLASKKNYICMAALALLKGCDKLTVGAGLRRPVES